MQQAQTGRQRNTRRCAAAVSGPRQAYTACTSEKRPHHSNEHVCRMHLLHIPHSCSPCTQLCTLSAIPARPERRAICAMAALAFCSCRHALTSTTPYLTTTAPHLCNPSCAPLPCTPFLCYSPSASRSSTFCSTASTCSTLQVPSTFHRASSTWHMPAITPRDALWDCKPQHETMTPAAQHRGVQQPHGSDTGWSSA